MATDVLSDFEFESISFDGREKGVFWKGNGPGVVLLTEIPGITPEAVSYTHLRAHET